MRTQRRTPALGVLHKRQMIHARQRMTFRPVPSARSCKAHQDESAADVTEWLTSPGLRLPIEPARVGREEQSTWQRVYFLPPVS